MPEGASVDLGALVARDLEQTPEKCAFRHGAAALSRGELLRTAQATAQRLTAHDLTPGEPVAIHIDHSFELAVAVCGVLMAGGCAVPIDPALSEARRRAITTDISPRIVLTNAESDADIAPGATRLPVRLEDSAGEAPTARTGAVDPATDLAFVIYTSGTSGGPKGVEITHDSYVSRLEQIVSVSSWDDSDVDLAWTPSSFIGMLDELFFPLLTGVPAVIASPEVRSDARAFGELVERAGITRFRITPSLLNAFLLAGIHDRLRGVRAVYCSGEAIPADLQIIMHSLPETDLIGFYGATEAPGVAFHLYDRAAPPLETTICTAQPFATLRIANENGTELPAGEAGEIWIGGCMVARGYRGKPELTAEKFVIADGLRWYRSGDRGRRLEDGRIELIGRIDLSEVNLHGVRISLPEIREALCRLDTVDDAWISVIEQEAGRDPVLVGHCIPAKGTRFDPSQTRIAVTAHLPTLAVPRYLIGHDQFPLTANGKLDVQALAQMAKSAPSAKAPGAASSNDPASISPTEMAVLHCFAEALDKRQIGLDDNFFEQGGTSLEAVTLACFISEHFESEIGFEELWLHPTPREMSACIAGLGGKSAARTFFHVEGVSGPNFIAIGFGVRHLAGLWPNRRLFVSPGIVGDPRITLNKRLDDYVSEYLEGLRRIQPKGPYQLFGFSFHGLLAYEVARRLHLEGEEISGLALLEPVTPMARATAPSYTRVAMRAALAALAKGRIRMTRNLLELLGNSRTGSRNGAHRRTRNAYGYVVAAAERLEPLPVPIDLIYCDAYPTRDLEQWKTMSGPNLRLRKVTAKEHKDLIQPDCVAQWKSVVDDW